MLSKEFGSWSSKHSTEVPEHERTFEQRVKIRQHTKQRQSDSQDPQDLRLENNQAIPQL